MERYLKNLNVQVKREDAVKITSMLEHAVNALVSNIVSMVCVIALINGASKVEPKHMVGASSYMMKACGWEKRSAKGKGQGHSQSGGTSMPASFFDPAADTMYSSGNAGPESADTVNFMSGLARAAIPIQMPADGPAFMDGGAGAGGKAVKFQGLVAMIQTTLDHYNMKISKQAKVQVIAMLHHLLHCLLAELKVKSGSALSASAVSKVLKMKRHAIFQ
jgi:hypothetical protein